MIGKNNPFNIRYSKRNRWRGQTGSTRGFCDFHTLYDGVRAAVYLVFKSYPHYGCTSLRDVISRFAPSNENDTEKYIAFVAKGAQIQPETDVICEPALVLYWMSRFEGNAVPLDFILDVLKKMRVYG